MMADKLKSKGNKRGSLNLRRFWPAYVMFLPVLVYYFVFWLLPLGGLTIAFKDYKVLKGISGSPWVGMKNFQKLFQTPSFMLSVRNTLAISLLNLLFGFSAPIIFAILLNEIRQLKFKKLVQTVSYLPNFISWSVVGGMIGMLLSPTSGPIASVVRSLGGSPVNYLNMKEYFRTIVVASGIWKGMGWGAIIYIAAMTSIDMELYDAARIDGAGRFARIWHVTLPGIREIVAIQLILNLGHILNVSFDQIFVLVNSMTLQVGETIDYYIYRVGLGSTNNFSLATASGLVKSIIGFVLIFTANKASKKLTGEGGVLW